MTTLHLKRLVVILFCILFLVCLFSCSPERKLQRIVKKHPELLKSDTLTVTLLADTVKIDSIVDNFITDLDTLLQDTCITEETREKIKVIFKERLVPQIIQGAIKDTTIEREGVKLFIRNTDKGIQFDIIHAKVQPIIRDSFIEEHYYWWIIAFLLLVIVLLILLRK